MKKMVYHTGANGERHAGYLPEYKWISTTWEQPSVPGRYLVIDHYGSLKEMRCTGKEEAGSRRLFELALNYGGTYRLSSDFAYVDDRVMTDTDIIDFYINPNYRWFEYNKPAFPELHVITEDDPAYPLYWLNLELGTEFTINCEGDLVTDDDPVYVDITGEIIEENLDKKLQEDKILKQRLDELNKCQRMDELYNKFHNKEDSDAEELS